MKEILRIDLKDYDESWPVIHRDAAKAVFYVDNKLVMLKSSLGDVKFIGGGIEKGESSINCLVREVKEETGFNVIKDSVKDLGIVVERRKDKYSDAVWDMTTYMYSCRVNEKNRGEMSLTENEKKHGMQCVYVNPEEAIAVNEEAMKKSTYNAWLYRDLQLLKLLYR